MNRLLTASEFAREVYEIALRSAKKYGVKDPEAFAVRMVNGYTWKTDATLEAPRTRRTLESES